MVLRPQPNPWSPGSCGISSSHGDSIVLSFCRLQPMSSVYFSTPKFHIRPAHHLARITTPTIRLVWVLLPATQELRVRSILAPKSHLRLLPSGTIRGYTVLLSATEFMVTCHSGNRQPTQSSTFRHPVLQTKPTQLL